MKKQNGITLIQLVVTIIVLLILAGIVLWMLSGEEGIINRANDAKEKTVIATEKEKIKLAYIDCESNYKLYKQPIDCDNYSAALQKRDENTKVEALEEGKEVDGEVVVEVFDKTNYARITFTETAHIYFVALIEFEVQKYSVVYNANGRY